MKFSLAACSLALALVCVLSFNGNTGSEAAPSNLLEMARDFLIKKFNENILSKSETVTAFRATMVEINARYEADVKAGKINEEDTDQATAAYQKILIDEIKKFRATIKEPVDEAKIDEIESQLCSQNKLMDACLRVAGDQESKINAEIQALTEDQSREEDRELELEEERSKIEKENEMGWALSPEAKEALKIRTREVLSDLLQNEVRQLAFAVLQAYTTGGALGPLIIALSGGLKTKIVRYFSLIIMDMLSTSVGDKVQIQLDPILTQDQAPTPIPAPIAAAA